MSRALRDSTWAALSGALLVCAFPAPGIGALAWVALVPLLVAIRGRRAGAALGLGLVTGAVYAAGVFSWIWQLSGVNVLNWALLDLSIAPYVGLFALGAAAFQRRTGLPFVAVAPPVWVAVELLRTHAGFLALPWMLLGHSQHGVPALVQLTALTGVYGLSWLLVAVNALVADWIAHGQAAHAAGRATSEDSGPARDHAGARTLALATGAVLVAVGGAIAYGLGVLAQPEAGTPVRVAAVQGNVVERDRAEPAGRARTLARYASLTHEVSAAAPRLVVWPETAVPGDLKHDPALHRAVFPLAQATGTFLLVGSSQYAKFENRALKDRHYNSMFLVAPTGALAGEYRKIALVPFGEYLPLPGIVRWPRVLAPGIAEHVAGTEHTVFAAGGLRFASVVCWEVIFPDLVREFVRRGAELIVIASNESWFGRSAVPEQMLVMAAFRAAEHRVPLVKVANTGITAFVDRHGRVVRRLHAGDGRELFVAGTLVGDLAVGGGGTFYTRHGDLFAYAQLAATLTLALAAAVPARARRRAVRTAEVSS